VKMKWMGVVLSTVVWGSAAWANPPKSTPELVEKGKALYATNCLACHGAQGQGDGPTGQYLNPKPRNLTSAEPFKNGKKPEEIFKTLTTGIPGSTMVPFAQVPEEGRWALTYYVLELQPKPAKEEKPAKKAGAKKK
jgi:mono/diheme cytochrome c family protein